jgi:Molecular chaperone
MPLLGRGSSLVEKGMTMPNALYRELATWATINFTYSYRNRREVTQLMREAEEPEKIARLLKVLHDRLGHRIAFAAEEGKIALSDSDSFELPLAFIEAGLSAPATRAGFDRAIRRGVERIGRAAADCVAAAGLQPGDIETIFFTGGSSRVPAVRAAIARAAPDARAMTGSDLLSVAWGLTQEATRRFA